jgi:hypothetical protein
MSYARLAEDSDVYVFRCVYGALECCGCSLSKNHWARFDTTDAMLAHLDEHKAAGHDVPERAIVRLIEEREENDAWIATQAAIREERPS